MSKKRKVKYKPLKSDVIDLSYAISEYTNLLQLAAKMSVNENREIYDVLRIAEMWFDFIKIIEPAEEEEEQPDNVFGFSKPEIERSNIADGISADKD